MALNDYETAMQLGEPVNLFEIVYGDTAALYYTDAEVDLDVEGTVYEKHAITRGDVKNDGKITQSDLTLTVPLTSPAAALFALYPPSVVVSIKIRQGHIPRLGEGLLLSNFPINFIGRILEARRDGNNAKLTCDPGTLARPGLTRNWQWGCPLVLYQSGHAKCGATKTAYPAEVSSVSNSSITLVDGWNVSGFADTKFITGLVEWDGTTTRERRYIRNVVDSGGLAQLQLFAPVWDLVATDSVDVYLGCRRTLDECDTLHSNVLNFGGQPFIPVEGNPVGKNNHF